MTLPQREHPDAVTEFDAAVQWYEVQSPGLGIRLIDSAEHARRSIAQWPNAWPTFPGWEREPWARSKKLDVYPYRIVYLVRDREIVIIAYAHRP